MARREKRDALRDAFLGYDDTPLRAVCQAIAKDDDGLLALAAQAQPGSYMPFFFLSCLRFLFLKAPKHPLAKHVLRPEEAGPINARQYAVLRAYCLERAATLRRLLSSARTQTNDVLRSAVLYPAFCLAAGRSGGSPLGLVEVGAAAGLNLCWDKYRYNYGEPGTFGAEESPVRLRLDWRGVPPGDWLGRVPEVAARVGIDLDPIDLARADEVLWLRSFLADTSGVLEAAIGVAQATERRLVRGDAVAKLAAAVEGLPAGCVATVFHSFCTYQFTDAALARFEAVIGRLGKNRPLHWIRLEGQSLELTSFTPGMKPSRTVLATTDLAGGVHRWFSWSYDART